MKTNSGHIRREVMGIPMLKYMCCPRLKKERKVL
jgi:hypothetical protein